MFETGKYMLTTESTESGEIFLQINLLKGGAYTEILELNLSDCAFDVVSIINDAMDNANNSTASQRFVEEIVGIA